MYAEEVGHYWKTSRTSADAWIAKAVKSEYHHAVGSGVI
jgi:hypothetical protein